MTDDRRYREDEVREIFELAASKERLGPPALSDQDGLTVEDLRRIALEVGLEPTRVAEAAAALDARRDVRPRGRHWGMPVSVGRTVELPRAPTDREWEMLVGELRATFGARGKVTIHGSLREWTNGNLFACAEPTETGHRLRLGTRKGNAPVLNAMGMTGLAMGLITLGAAYVSGQLPDGIFGPLIFGMMGAGALGFNALRLSRWAQRREDQMKYIVSRASALLELTPEDESPGD